MHFDELYVCEFTRHEIGTAANVVGFVREFAEHPIYVVVGSRSGEMRALQMKLLAVLKYLPIPIPKSIPVKLTLAELQILHNSLAAAPFVTEEDLGTMVGVEAPEVAILLDKVRACRAALPRE
jgi:hypothetical protein